MARAAQPKKPRSRWLNLVMLGATGDISLSLTPNQRARVAAYWSTEVLGSSRPWPTSSGPFSRASGAVP